MSPKMSKFADVIGADLAGEQPAEQPPAAAATPPAQPRRRRSPRKDTRTHARKDVRADLTTAEQPAALGELWAAGRPDLYLLTRQLARQGRKLAPGRGVNLRMPFEIDAALGVYVDAMPKGVDRTAVMVALLDAFLRDQGIDIDTLAAGGGGQQ